MNPNANCDYSDGLHDSSNFDYDDEDDYDDGEELTRVDDITHAVASFQLHSNFEARVDRAKKQFPNIPQTRIDEFNRRSIVLEELRYKREKTKSQHFGNTRSGAEDISRPMFEYLLSDKRHLDLKGMTIKELAVVYTRDATKRMLKRFSTELRSRRLANFRKCPLCIPSLLVAGEKRINNFDTHLVRMLKDNDIPEEDLLRAFDDLEQRIEGWCHLGANGDWERKPFDSFEAWTEFDDKVRGVISTCKLRMPVEEYSSDPDEEEFEQYRATYSRLRDGQRRVVLNPSKPPPSSPIVT
jgi:hypothetical protein